MEGQDQATLVYLARWYDVRSVLAAGVLMCVVALAIAALATLADPRADRDQYGSSIEYVQVSNCYIGGVGGRTNWSMGPGYSSASQMFGFGIRIKLVPYETSDIEKLVARQERGRWVCGTAIMPCSGVVFQKNR